MAPMYANPAVPKRWCGIYRTKKKKNTSRVRLVGWEIRTKDRVIKPLEKHEIHIMTLPEPLHRIK